MQKDRTKPVEEKMELSHEPVAPYRGVFYAAISVASLYLGWILFKTI